MKLSLKNHITACLFMASVALFAQKQSKNYSESFNVKKDATVEINASHADVEVTTWTKNQVDVQATIEIEGLSKEEAEKYLKNFKFEALGNSNKVRIEVGGNNPFTFNGNDFVIFNAENFKIPEINIPEIDIPEIDFQMPEIHIPDLNFTMPDVTWEKFMIDLDDAEFDFDKYSKDGKNYFFRWKDSVRDIKIKSKKEWEKFKNSEDYKTWKAEMKKNQEKLKNEWKAEWSEAKKEINGMNLQKIVEESLKQAQKAMESIDMEGIIKESLREAKKAMEEIDQEEIRREIAKVRNQFHRSFNSDTDELTINGKKVKIKKKITIKVPKGVKLDLNTRHCQLKLPKMTASGKVAYGTFNADALEGGELNIRSAPVQINLVKNATLHLKNVTDATLASVANSSVTADSGDLEILELYTGTNIETSFGDVVIKKVGANLGNFKLVLNQSEANINLVGFNKTLNFDTKNNKGKIVTYDRVYGGGKGMSFKGDFTISSQGDEVNITGKYSELIIKQ
jgi:hypothetical protein